MASFRLTLLVAILGAFCALSFANDNFGVLITGGSDLNYVVSNKAELYVPSTNSRCTLPSLPDKRFRHTVSEGGLICGGYFTEKSCIQWSPDSGTWEEALTLDVGREKHVSWTPSSDTTKTYLMGGANRYSRNTTTLITNNRIQEPGFPLKYQAERACALPDPVSDTVVVTGGIFTMTTVVRYGQQGWVEDLPPLITGRRDHACSSFMASGRLMFLVTGGYDGEQLFFHSNTLDSIEIFDPLVGSWTTSRAKLPIPLGALRAEGTLLFGGHGNYDEQYKIMEYDPEDDTITVVGRMTRKRSHPAVSVVSAADFTKVCAGSM